MNWKMVLGALLVVSGFFCMGFSLAGYIQNRKEEAVKPTFVFKAPQIDFQVEYEKPDFPVRVDVESPSCKEKYPGAYVCTLKIYVTQ